MSQAPSTFGSMTTSSFDPTAATISTMSSRSHGELSALTRVHRPVAPKSFALAMAMNPARAAALASAGIASSRLPSTTSTCAINSGTLARSFSICGGTKWIMRSSLTGSSRSGAGAPIASGLKKLRGSFMSVPISYSKRDGRFPLRYGEHLSLAKPLLRAAAERLTNARAAGRQPHARSHQSGAAVFWFDLPRAWLWEIQGDSGRRTRLDGLLHPLCGIVGVVLSDRCTDAARATGQSISVATLTTVMWLVKTHQLPVWLFR